MAVSRSTSGSRRWYKPQITTVIAIIVVATALIHVQRETEPSGAGSMWSVTWRISQGWPMICRESIVHERVEVDFDSPNPQYITNSTTNIYWVPLGVVVNLLASVLILGSTVAVFERWRRSASPWQFNLRTFLTLVTVIGVLLVMYQNEASIRWWLAGFVTDPMVIMMSGLRLYPWYVYVPITLGIACMTFTFCRLALFVASKLFRATIGKFKVPGTRMRPVTASAQEMP